MKYMGSKNRHAKELLSIILKNRERDQYYVEPFVGGFNMIDKVENPRIANDTHYYLIELFRAIQAGWEPPDQCTELEYDVIKNNYGKTLSVWNYLPALVGFVGFGCSYSGKWFGGLARGNDSKGNPRNYCLESKKNILAQKEAIKGIEIYNLDYKDIPIPANSIIYCDPPYANSTKYRSGDFSHEEFWNWVRKKSQEGHQVFVSEYQAPDDFECLWSKKVNNTLTKDTGSKQGVEKLFKWKGPAS